MGGRPPLRDTAPRGGPPPAISQADAAGDGVLYMLVPLPMGLAYFRARFEKEAYAETIRAAAEVWGREYARQSSSTAST